MLISFISIFVTHTCSKQNVKSQNDKRSGKCPRSRRSAKATRAKTAVMSARVTKVSLLALAVLSLTSVKWVKCDSPLLKDVTQQVFGSDLKRLPVAFGDFNGDKMTDLFVLPQSNHEDREYYY